ncbi:MAG: LamG domain-containing protein [Ignavibacteria bacterium]|jgi:hypothetical protein
MKTNIVIKLLVIFFIGISIKAQSTDGLEAYYSFDGTTGDQSGNNNNPTYVLGGFISDQWGNALSAYYLNNDNTGSQEYLYLPDIFPDNLTEFTISGWVKCLGDNSKSAYVQMICDFQSQYVIYVIITPDEGSGTAELDFMINGNTSTSSVEYTFNLNEWHHFVGVYGNDQLSLYIDGNLINTVTPGSLSTSTGLYTAIGKTGDDRDNFHFNGFLDEFRIYSRELTSTEIAELYTTPHSGGGDDGGSSLWSSGSGDDIYRDLGNVGIGTDDPQGYKLAVAGDMIAEEVVVKLEDDWPDKVFEEDYDLKPLTEVENFIKENKHLPDIPSAEEVKEEGLSIGEMQAKLLEKIEELTLYTIELNKKYIELSKQNEELKKAK